MSQTPTKTRQDAWELVTEFTQSETLKRHMLSVEAGAVFEGLKERQILVRYFTKPPLDGWLRITIGTRDQLAKVLRGITEILQG